VLRQKQASLSVPGRFHGVLLEWAFS
jgi:hypothetical protein